MWDWFLGMSIGTELVDDTDQVVTVLLHARLVEALHLLQVLFRGRPNQFVLTNTKSIKKKSMTFSFTHFISACFKWLIFSPLDVGKRKSF